MIRFLFGFVGVLLLLAPFVVILWDVTVSEPRRARRGRR